MRLRKSVEVSCHIIITHYTLSFRSKALRIYYLYNYVIRLGFRRNASLSVHCVVKLVFLCHGGISPLVGRLPCHGLVGVLLNKGVLYNYSVRVGFPHRYIHMYIHYDDCHIVTNLHTILLYWYGITIRYIFPVYSIIGSSPPPPSRL